jgi:type IV pilus assembly protein PilC
MVKAGEIGGALDVTLTRLAEFMEKAQRVKGKVKAAMFYPCAVLTVASAILALLMTFVVPRFQLVFEGLLNGTPLPAFTRLIFRLSQFITGQFLLTASMVAGLSLLIFLASQTLWGRWALDRAKLAIPVLGPLFRKAAISRFSRTLGTLLSNGVPILQSLTIVKETAGNVVLGNVVALLHENVKQGEPLAPAIRGSNLFPVMVAGMVDVGEQTGALPEMLMKIADNYDNEVDNAASALTSLLEPIMIVFLAVIVGSIVIAMFLPLLFITEHGIDGPSHGSLEE